MWERPSPSVDWTLECAESARPNPHSSPRGHGAAAVGQPRVVVVVGGLQRGHITQYGGQWVDGQTEDRNHKASQGSPGGHAFCTR